MSRRTRRAISKAALSNPVIRQDACGIDIGATEIYVSVAPDRDEEPVRCFATFTSDLEALADWLKACHVKSVAMESTGVYWIPLFQILESRGFEVLLVNAHHLKSVPGRKSDVCDCQWIQYCHAVGLLNGSFRPPQEVCALRSIVRHRDDLVKSAAEQIQKMQKALTQMNLQIHHVLSDISGKSGLAIIDAILKGERDAKTLARLRDGRVKACEEVVTKSLVGDYRPEHIFTLDQCRQIYRHYHVMIKQCDAQIAQMLAQIESTQPLPSAVVEERPKPTIRKEKPRKNEIALPEGSLSEQMYRIFRTDLTRIPGLASTTVHRLFTELGADLAAFRTAAHFVSWLGLCPDNRVSGGKVLSVKTRDIKNRVADMFRVAAQSLHGSDSYLGQFYRRMRARLGGPKAVTATAHKLARIFYHLVTTQAVFDESVYADVQRRYEAKQRQSLIKKAAQFGCVLTPIANN